MVSPKKIKLPTKTATLIANCKPVASKGSSYNYTWALVFPDGKEGDGRLKRLVFDSNEEELNLSNLEEGEYSFTVTVTGNQCGTASLKGETNVKVTVFPGR